MLLCLDGLVGFWYYAEGMKQDQCMEPLGCQNLLKQTQILISGRRVVFRSSGGQSDLDLVSALVC